MNEQQQWYAAKVKPHTEKKIRNYFSENGIEHYIPFQTVVVECRGRKAKKEKPLISGLVFVRTTKQIALTLPQLSGFTLNFMHNRETKDLLTIPEKQMSDFMFVLNLSEKAMPIPNNNLRRGDKVRVIKGSFAGVEGELVRIKGHKRVVVRLEGIFSLATTYIPGEFLEKVEN